MFNVILNLFFVIVCKMDVPGVALATIISQAISALFIVIALRKTNGFFEFKFKKIRFYKQEALEIARIGLPAGLQGAIFSLSNVLIQSSINGLGTIVMDGNGASGSLEGFVYTSMNSVAQACVAFISANYGAGNSKNIKKSLISSVTIIMLAWAIVSSVVLVFGHQLLGLYVKSDEAIAYGFERLTIICSTYFLCGLMDTFAYSLRGIGYSLLPTIISLCGACGLRILWILLLFPLDYFHNLGWLAASYPISWIITASIHLVLFLVLFQKQKKNNLFKDQKCAI